MASYDGIAAVSEKICENLRAALTPDIIKSPDGIGLCSPDDRGDIRLGIFLYEIERSDEVRRNEMVNLDEVTQGYIPIYLTLSYMFTAYTPGDIRYRMYEEQKILGRVVQYFSDYPWMYAMDTDPNSLNSVDMRVDLLKVDSEERSKIWTFPNIPYKLSVFYRVTPVVIDSARTREVRRVTNASFNVGYSTRKRNS